MANPADVLNSQAAYRELKARLRDEGFEILDAWHGRHLRVRVARNGKEATLTMASSARDEDNAVANTMKQAMRATAAR